ncbi:hypothetical protein P256_01816 [Acinetobacter nectaris CIP 110549]|uniref:Uncharacterized protein n=1 Tax=Acinetobacter nectaris CIP 110549 TaxID=1392540 RepID=V2TQK6_9GAMM|nr:hypothetical protein P256_01816 [Acinetobacter nectaris CIP 110549]
MSGCKAERLDHLKGLGSLLYFKLLKHPFD